jgi:hypothetical protein
MAPRLRAVLGEGPRREAVRVHRVAGLAVEAVRNPLGGERPLRDGGAELS